MATTMLIILAAGTGWVTWLYVSPFRHCRRCRGSGRRTRTLTRRRFELCPRCGGAGRVPRTGSRMVHRAVLIARSELARERQRRRDRAAAERRAR